MDWPGMLARANAAQLRAFGEAITYEQPPAEPYTVTAVRGSRDPAEGDGLAAFERVWSVSGQFAAPPKKGDRVTIGGVEYVVHTIKPDEDPASDGLRLYLNRRQRLEAANA